MPQASEELRAKFPGWDSEALEVLVANFTVTKGVIRKRCSDYQLTPREWDAVDYLFHEWDYAYEELEAPCGGASCTTATSEIGKPTA